MKNRSVPKVIIFSLITLGIYTLFWLRDTRKELIAHGQDVLPVKILLIPVVLLAAASVVQFLFRLLFQGDGVTNSTSMVLNILSVLIGIIVVVAVVPLTVWWFYKYCKAVEVVTQGQTSLTFSLGTLIILGLFGASFVWPGLIQDGYNRLSTPQSPGLAPAA